MSVTITQTIVDGTTIKGVVTWTAQTSDDSQVDHVSFLVDDVVVHTEDGPPWGNGDPPLTDAGQYKTAKLTDGAHKLSSIASKGGVTLARVDAHVIVANAVTPPAPPPVPSSASAQSAINAIKATNPKIAAAIQETLDYAKAVYAARNRP